MQAAERAWLLRMLTVGQLGAEQSFKDYLLLLMCNQLVCVSGLPVCVSGWLHDPCPWRAQEVPLVAQLLADGGSMQAVGRAWLLRLLAAGLRGPSDGPLYRWALCR